MDRLSKKISEKKQRPIKVLQFGEGNFLRAFVDYFIDITNEVEEFNAGIVLVKPIEFGNLSRFEEQDCQYTVSLRGVVGKEPKVLNRLVSSVQEVCDCYSEYDHFMEYAGLSSLRFIVSNTTEAGIAFDDTDRLEDRPPKSYPGKLTKFLYERYQRFHGDFKAGLIILPVELIDDNGVQLKRCVLQYVELWNLEEGFSKWLNDACIFCSTLVDRIVTGYPREEAPRMWKSLGYQDELLVTAEPFGLWVIESERDFSEEFPLVQAGLPVLFTRDQKPYKQRKVRILNGAHTSFVHASYLAGNDLVLESMEDALIRTYMEKTIFEEVIPTLTLPKEDLLKFADAVITRFQNPYVKHQLLSISLNSISKWRARCLPSLLGYIEKFHKLPEHFCFSLAAMMRFYHAHEMKDGVMTGYRNGEPYQIIDEESVLQFFRGCFPMGAEEYTNVVLQNESFWGQDLRQIKGLQNKVCHYYEDIESLGMRPALEKNFGKDVKEPEA